MNSIQTQADQLASEFQTAFQGDYAQAQTLLNTKTNMQNLLLVYTQQTDELRNKQENNTTEQVTNDRRTFYELQGRDRQSLWNSVFYWSYYVLLAVVLIWKFRPKVGFVLMAVLLGVYPIVVKVVTNYLAYLFNSAYEFLPHSVYG